MSKYLGIFNPCCLFSTILEMFLIISVYGHIDLQLASRSTSDLSIPFMSVQKYK